MALARVFAVAGFTSISRFPTAKAAGFQSLTKTIRQLVVVFFDGLVLSELLRTCVAITAPLQL